MNFRLHATLFALSALCYGEEAYSGGACVPIAPPAGYEAPGKGRTSAHFDRKARAPYWDPASGSLVFECCQPPISRKNGVSFFYMVQYRLSDDGRTLERHQRRWASHEVPAKEPCISVTKLQTDTPFVFSNGRRLFIFTVNDDGEIVRVMSHACTAPSGKTPAPEGRVIYPTHHAPSLVHDLM